MPKGCKLKLFRVLVSPHRIGYLLTNEVEPHETATAEQENSARWTIEPFHHEHKQLTGGPTCQYQLARSQRNHIALAVLALTQLKQGFLNGYMRHELKQSSLAFAQVLNQSKSPASTR